MKTTTPKINNKADALNSYRVTDEQLSKCELIQNGSTGKYFVLVESMSEQGTIYRVEYDSEKKCLRCLPHTGTPCKAQDAGYSSCWHRRAACATFALFRLEQRNARRAEDKAVEETAEYREERAIVDLEWALEEAKAAKREAAAVRRNGRNAYQPTEIRRDEKYGIILR
jgi:hypothetical protein